MTFKETNMNTYRGLILSFTGALLAALLLLPSAARAQATTASVLRLCWRWAPSSKRRRHPAQ